MGKGIAGINKKITAGGIAATLLLLVMAIIVIFPLLWVFLTSLKTNRDFYANVWGLPEEWMWQNYMRAWTRGNIGRGFLNSIFVTFGSLALGLCFSTTTAYAFARFKFRGRRLMRSVYLAAIMVPEIIALIPQYFLLIHLNLLDNLNGLILIYALSSLPFSQFVLYGFYATLPHELDEAATIDGASHFRIFIRIMLPLAQAGIITIIVVNFISHWNEYFKALIYLSSPLKFTIPVGLVVFTQMSQYRIDWGALMASNVILIVPTIIVYCVFLRTIQKGLTVGAIKG